MIIKFWMVPRIQTTGYRSHEFENSNFGCRIKPLIWRLQLDGVRLLPPPTPSLTRAGIRVLPSVSSLLPEPVTGSCIPLSQFVGISKMSPHSYDNIPEGDRPVWSGREITARLTSNIPITLMNCRADGSVDKSSTSLYLLLLSALRFAIHSLFILQSAPRVPGEPVHSFRSDFSISIIPLPDVSPAFGNHRDSESSIPIYFTSHPSIIYL